MTRRGPWLALLASGALAIVACSSGGSPAPSVNAPPSSVTSGLLTEEFATPLPSDTAQAEVIAGFREGLVLWNSSSERFALVAPVTSYVTGAALGNLKKVISIFSKSHEVPAGVDRLFLTKVTDLTGSTATVTTCDDGSKYVQKNPTTGAVDPAFTNVPIDQQYIYEAWAMTRLSGHWAIESITITDPPAAVAKQCLPT
jgi:hypothetical protein